MKNQHFFSLAYRAFAKMNQIFTFGQIFMKNLQLKFALLGIAGIILLLFQSKLVMPLIYKVVSSDIFLEKNDDKGSQIAVSNKMTTAAFMQCNNYAKKKASDSSLLSFSKEPLNTWGIGNYEYIVNAEIRVSQKNAATTNQRYVCNIRYKNKNDLAGLNQEENWIIDGLSGLNL
ncbi:MAG: hypothetical protein RL637_552 [Pseudomonadota bacterium]